MDEILKVISKKMTFKKGGIHPDDNKHYTKNKTIEILPTPAEVTIPLTQHIGAMGEPLVKVGDYVKKYQVLSTSSAFVFAPVHASCSGTVKAVEPRRIVDGRRVMSVTIENDGAENEEECAKTVDFRKLSPDEIVKRVKDAGIVGLGGATFPTHIKLSPPPDRTIDKVIVNASECEPYLTSDYRVLLEDGESVLKGLAIVLHRFGLSEGYIGIEGNKPDAIAYLRRIAPSNIHVCELKTRYPQGSEKHLIYAITKRKVPSGKLPSDVGALVLNVDTIRAIYRTITWGKPLISRIVTVAGNVVGSPKNLKVSVGTPLSYLLAACSTDVEKVRKLIVGGPMMGTAVPDADYFVAKGVSALLAFDEGGILKDGQTNCIRCGRCASVCPMELFPAEIEGAAIANDWEYAKKLGVKDCIECGCCTYGCPARRHLVQVMRKTKARV